MKQTTTLFMLVVLALLATAATSALDRTSTPARLQPSDAAYRIDLNSADAPTLALLPGVGPGLAKKIIDHRLRSGPFSSIDQLASVPSIGPKTLEHIKPWAVCSTKQNLSLP